jgi:hypothetical protein
LPDIFVSKAALPVALDLASELFLALEDRGYNVSLSVVRPAAIAEGCHTGRSARGESER